MQTKLKVHKIFVQFHYLSSCQNDFVSKWLVSIPTLQPAESGSLLKTGLMIFRSEKRLCCMVLTFCPNYVACQCRGGCRGCAPSPLRWPSVFWYNWYSAKKKTMWFIGVEVEQEMSAPPPKKNPGSAPAMPVTFNQLDGCIHLVIHRRPRCSMCQINIIIFTWTKYDESSKLPWTKIVQKSKYNKTKLRYL